MTSAPKTVPVVKLLEQITEMQPVITEKVITTAHTWTLPFQLQGHI
jgi:hypothetical protein